MRAGKLLLSPHTPPPPPGGLLAPPPTPLCHCNRCRGVKGQLRTCECRALAEAGELARACQACPPLPPQQAPGASSHTILLLYQISWRQGQLRTSGCRALAEEDEAANGQGGPVEECVGTSGQELYRRGTFASSPHKTMSAYLIRNAGMFMDVAEGLVNNHLRKEDLYSGLITSEWCAYLFSPDADTLSPMHLGMRVQNFPEMQFCQMLWAQDQSRRCKFCSSLTRATNRQVPASLTIKISGNLCSHVARMEDPSLMAHTVC